MSYNYSSYIQFGIKNDVERFSYVGWLIFVVMCSLLGDTTILVASIKYNAFRLHRTVVVFIQHIAVCDLLNATGNIFPAVLSLIYNRGGSSDILNFIRFFINYWVYTTSPALISGMTIGKLLLLRYPLRARSWSTRKSHELCLGLWIASLSVPVLHLLVDKDDITFDYRSYTYNYKYSARVWEILMPSTTLLAHLLPNICIVTSTILLLKDARKVARRTHESLRWQGSMTVVLTAMVYTLSFLPITVYFLAKPLVERNPDPTVPGPFYNEFYRVSEAVLNINVLANFFVYSVTVTSFRNFLKAQFFPTLSFPSNTKSHKVFCFGRCCFTFLLNLFSTPEQTHAKGGVSIERGVYSKNSTVSLGRDGKKMDCTDN